MKLKYFYIFTICSIIVAACGGGSNENSEQTPQEDTVLVEEIDTIETDPVPVAIPPKKADELFDDFVYAFMHNKKFQRSRIDFPLKNMVEGEDEPIDYKSWKHDPMYSVRDLYMTISPSAKIAKLSKDTSINYVLVQEVNPVSEAVKQYTFERKEAQWKLTEINHTNVANLKEGSDFMSFYCKFATDSVFQMQHINPVVDIDVEEENYEERLEGNISAEQWPEFAPQLPRDELMCVRYGQEYEKSKKRIVNIDSPSGDAGISMEFELIDGEWRLVRYKN